MIRIISLWCTFRDSRLERRARKTAGGRCFVVCGDFRPAQVNLPPPLESLYKLQEKIQPNYFVLLDFGAPSGTLALSGAHGKQRVAAVLSSVETSDLRK